MSYKEQSRRLNNVVDLRSCGLLPENSKEIEQVASKYEVGITTHVCEVIERSGNPEEHPFALQFLPNIQELNIMKDEDFDPIGDHSYSPVNGIVHRYPDRALLKITNICAAYCRFCFRREMIGFNADSLSQDEIAAAIDYIRAHKEIWEVILTGGDPLILSSRRMRNLLNQLEKIDHVRVVRIHSRIPIIDPSRIDDTLMSVLKNVNKALHIVIHINHAEEITKESEAVFARMCESNCSLSSQSVLLKGVNDSVKALEDLFRTLIALQVKPYYLHHLDHARGTSHFRVPMERGRELMKSLQGRISGICLPKYMLDIPGGHGKVPINDDYVIHQGNGVYKVIDYQGCSHLYIE